MYELRELERRDIETINLWRRNRELIENLGAPFRYINSDVDNLWYDSYIASRNSAIRCVVVDEKDQVLCLVSLTNIDRINQSAVIHIMIGEKKNRCKGIGTFAMSNMIDHAFNDMNIRRIELSVLKDNIYAQKLYEKLGFKVEGEKREAVYKNGKFVNMYTMAILKSEYEKDFKYEKN